MGFPGRSFSRRGGAVSIDKRDLLHNNILSSPARYFLMYRLQRAHHTSYVYTCLPPSSTYIPYILPGEWETERERVFMGVLEALKNYAKS